MWNFLLNARQFCEKHYFVAVALLAILLPVFGKYWYLFNFISFCGGLVFKRDYWSQKVLILMSLFSFTLPNKRYKFFQSISAAISVAGSISALFFTFTSFFLVDLFIETISSFKRS